MSTKAAARMRFNRTFTSLKIMMPRTSKTIILSRRLVSKFFILIHLLFSSSLLNFHYFRTIIPIINMLCISLWINRGKIFLDEMQQIFHVFSCCMGVYFMKRSFLHMDMWINMCITLFIMCITC